MTLTEELRAIYSGRGGGTYFGEVVTTLEHSLQAAHFARESEAPDALVLAALLHDIGHLIDVAARDFADWKTDARHEVSGIAGLPTPDFAYYRGLIEELTGEERDGVGAGRNP